MTIEERFRQQSLHYVQCFVNECPGHETCLHWLTGQHSGVEDYALTTINPHNPDVKAGQCKYYRQNVKVQYAVGFMHLFDDIPYAVAKNIKQRLINLFTRTRFYQYRNGERPIPPEQQQQIARICQEEGWTGDIQYDGWQEDFLW